MSINRYTLVLDGRRHRIALDDSTIDERDIFDRLVEHVPDDPNAPVIDDAPVACDEAITLGWLAL